MAAGLTDYRWTAGDFLSLNLWCERAAARDCRHFCKAFLRHATDPLYPAKGGFMNTLEPQYQCDRIAALTRLGVPESEHHWFPLSTDEQTVYINGPDGVEIGIGMDESVMHEGGMSEAIEKKLRAAGIRRSVTGSWSN
jgi:hypothetical protein